MSIDIQSRLLKDLHKSEELEEFYINELYDAYPDWYLNLIESLIKNNKEYFFTEYSDKLKDIYLNAIHNDNLFIVESIDNHKDLGIPEKDLFYHVFYTLVENKMGEDMIKYFKNALENNMLMIIRDINEIKIKQIAKIYKIIKDENLFINLPNKSIDKIEKILSKDS